MTYRQAVHIHIPKTAGTSVTQYMKRVFGNKKVAHFGRRDRTAQFRKMNMEELRKYRCVGAHLPYRLLYDKLGASALYFTVLRDPYDLFTSYYSDISNRDTHPLHEVAKAHTQLSFLEYVSENNILKPQVSYLSDRNDVDHAATLISDRNIVAATLSNVNELLAYVASSFGKDPVAVPHKNNSTKKPIENAVEVRKAAYEFYNDDVKLISFVEQYWQR